MGTWDDVTVEYLDKVISVRPRVFMPEPYDMSKFMDNNTKLVTTISDGNNLDSAPFPANMRTTTTM